MSGSKRMRASARREAILRAVAPVFAEKGFHGATTKELAAAAGVSEALLYRHFPAKEALYVAMRAQDFAGAEAERAAQKLQAMAPSTARLALTVHFLVADLVESPADTLPRLVVQSLLGDGAFARGFFERFRERWVCLVRESVEAAARAGDVAVDARTDLADVEHVLRFALAFRFMRFPGGAPAGPGDSPPEMVGSAVKFALRGLGMKPRAIERYYDPKGLRYLAG